MPKHASGGIAAIFLCGVLASETVQAESPIGTSSIPTPQRQEATPKILPIRILAAQNITYAEEPDVTPPAGPKGTRVELLPLPGLSKEVIGKQNKIDPQIKPLGALTTLVSPPREVDKQGNSLPFPEDYSAAYFAEVAPIARFPEMHEPWRGEAEYSLNFDFCYRPLYFEEFYAERYGYAYGLFQPVVSAAHFYTTIPLLPVKTIVERPGWCTLHPERDLPGFPPLRQRPRWRILEAIRSVSTAGLETESTGDIAVDPLPE